MIKPDTLSPDFIVCAWSEGPRGEREIMGVRHRKFALYGVQFHPESFLTHRGTHLLETFLKVKQAA